MPYPSLHPCAKRDCGRLATARFCEAHVDLELQSLRQWREEMEQQRPSRHERGYDSKWVTARTGYLAHHPLCVACQAEGRVIRATIVDHIVPHRGDMKLFWDKTNWQPLCKRHHQSKTAQEQAGRRKIMREGRG